jgi:hypothetical protein
MPALAKRPVKDQNAFLTSPLEEEENFYVKTNG